MSKLTRRKPSWKRKRHLLFHRSFSLLYGRASRLGVFICFALGIGTGLAPGIALLIAYWGWIADSLWLRIALLALSIETLFWFAMGYLCWRTYLQAQPRYATLSGRWRKAAIHG